ncbi:MAG: multidrug transporter MdfA, partial [Acinetobacter sp.]|nr:multidrug transporter MdfA [Acinetobacter sp.]
YEYLHIWAYGVSCFALIALWFSFPRAMLNKVLQQRKAEGQF